MICPWCERDDIQLINGYLPAHSLPTRDRQCKGSRRKPKDIAFDVASAALLAKARRISRQRKKQLAAAKKRIRKLSGTLLAVQRVMSRLLSEQNLAG